MVSFLKIFQIFVQCATWFKFAMSILTPFFEKILIRNKLYQLHWNIISVQIFGILSLLKMWLLSQLGENLFCQVRRWQGQPIFSTLERHYIGDGFVKILRSICTCWNILVWVEKSLFLFCATWFISHVGCNTELFFTMLLFFGKTIFHEKKSQISDNFDH